MYNKRLWGIDFNSTQTFIPRQSSLAKHLSQHVWGKCGENPENKNRLTLIYQQIKRFYWYPEPGSNRHDIAVIGV